MVGQVFPLVTFLFFPFAFFSSLFFSLLFLPFVECQSCCAWKSAYSGRACTSTVSSQAAAHMSTGLYFYYFFLPLFLATISREKKSWGSFSFRFSMFFNNVFFVWKPNAAVTEGELQIAMCLILYVIAVLAALGLLRVGGSMWSDRSHGC